MAETPADPIAGEARRLIASRFVADPLVVESGRVEAARPVRHPEGSDAGWFVPVVVDDRLAGFFQFDSESRFLRYSSFQRRAGSIEGCPDASDWLDPLAITQRASTALPSGRSAGAPYLTYDQNVTRLVWAVPMRDATDHDATVFVAGAYAYLP